MKAIKPKCSYKILITMLVSNEWFDSNCMMVRKMFLVFILGLVVMHVSLEESPTNFFDIAMVYAIKRGTDNIHLALRRGLAGSLAQVAVQFPYATSE